jgi:lysophospholipase L1-like esterase
MIKTLTATLMRVTALTLVACLCGCGGGPKIKALEPGAIIVAFGESLTEGSGASEEESYPAVLATLAGCKVINAGVPGEVSEEGRQRLPSVLREHKPDLVILCHGGNDMLQRVDEAVVAAHVQAMVEAAQAAGADVILLGVPRPGLFLKAPAFYAEVAKRCGVPCDVKILPEILATRALKSDTIHPNAAGYRKLAQRVAALIRKSQG